MKETYLNKYICLIFCVIFLFSLGCKKSIEADFQDYVNKSQPAYEAFQKNNNIEEVRALLTEAHDFGKNLLLNRESELKEIDEDRIVLGFQRFIAIQLYYVLLCSSNKELADPLFTEYIIDEKDGRVKMNKGEPVDDFALDQNRRVLMLFVFVFKKAYWNEQDQKLSEQIWKENSKWILDENWLVPIDPEKEMFPFNMKIPNAVY